MVGSKFLIISLLAGIASALSQVHPSAVSIVLWCLSWSLFLSLVAKKGNTYTKVLVTGYAFGLGQFTSGLHWFFSVVQSDPNTSALPAMLLVLFIISYLAIWPAIVGLAYYWAKHSFSDAKANLIILPLVAVIAELLRAHLFTGFPFLQPAYLFVEYDLSGYLPVLGSYALNFFAYLLVGIILWVNIDFARHKLLASFAVVFLVVSVGFILKQIEWVTFDEADTLSFHLLAGDFERGKSQNRAEIIDRVERYTEYALKKPTADIAVWPESAIGINYEAVLPYIEPSLKRLDNAGVRLLSGGYKALDYDKSANVLFDSDTRSVGYSKQHLVPFGEYTPSWLQWAKSLIGQRPLSNIAVIPSEDKPIKHNQWTLLPNMCFELLYEFEWLAKTQHADAIIHITDLSWIEPKWVRQYFQRVARVKAVESGKPLLYIGNNDRSSVFQPSYKQPYLNQQYDANALNMNIYKAIGTTPLVRFVSWFN